MTATRQSVTASGARMEREAAEQQRKHRDKVEELKRRGFTDPAMREWTFANDNGRNPQMKTAHFYVEHWEDMKAGNIGYLLWGRRRHRQKLPCWVHCKRPHGERNLRKNDELCHYPG